MVILLCYMTCFFVRLLTFMNEHLCLENSHQGQICYKWNTSDIIYNIVQKNLNKFTHVIAINEIFWAISAECCSPESRYFLVIPTIICKY